MGLGMVLVGGLALLAAGVDRLRRGDRVPAVALTVAGALITVAGLLAIVNWSPLFG